MKSKAISLRPSFLIIALLTLSSCAVMLVGPYDEVTDKAVTDLESKTELFFAKLANTHGRYEDNKSFYNETKASLSAIKLRAELYPKNGGELKAIDLLTDNFKNLEELNQVGPLTPAVASPAHSSIQTNFQSLLQIELAKKRSSGISPAKQ
jgi:hypothetical protein